MDVSDLPEPLRARYEEQRAKPARDTVREFLFGYVADAESFDEIRATLRRTASVSTLGLEWDLAALETVLRERQPDGELAHLVAWEANWVLDDLSDAGAGLFLGELAQLLQEVLAESGR